ncbi:hypothetical protein LTR27_008021 [Elasticomyces elasticus]|nr:hypothetical protein LTR27_008021 [Elasticomyces elasticus]
MSPWPSPVQPQRNAASRNAPRISTSSGLPTPATQDLGIPQALIPTLVELYFSNVYNAELLFHKRSFLEALALGTTRPHVILAICAWGAKFYRDTNGQANIKDQGFMDEWAHRANRLAFQEMHEFHDDSLATFINLSIFWHSQGSWRMAMLCKGLPVFSQVFVELTSL